MAYTPDPQPSILLAEKAVQKNRYKQQNLIHIELLELRWYVVDEFVLWRVAVLHSLFFLRSKWILSFFTLLAFQDDVGNC